MIEVFHGLIGAGVALDEFAHLAVVEHFVVPAEHLAEGLGVRRHELKDTVDEVDIAVRTGLVESGDVEVCEVALQIGDVVFVLQQAVHAGDIQRNFHGLAEHFHLKGVEVGGDGGDLAI